VLAAAPPPRPLQYTTESLLNYIQAAVDAGDFNQLSILDTGPSWGRGKRGRMVKIYTLYVDGGGGVRVI